MSKRNLVELVLIFGLLIVGLVLLTSCGSTADDCNSQGVADNNHMDCNKSKEVEKEPAVVVAPKTVVQGSIVSAFEINVDDKNYNDIEDYYGSLLDSLPAKVASAGYVDYTVKLDAELGFKDLTNNTKVHVQSLDSRGYSGSTNAKPDGSFNLTLPSGAEGDYKIRANKRISVTLKKDKEVVKICFNFSAVDKSVTFDQIEKPVILDTFRTSITKYDCSDEIQAEKGLVIPDNKIEVPVAQHYPSVGESAEEKKSLENN